MASYQSNDIRNIALFGHAASGKTTLTEAILSASGEIKQPGSVEKGNTVTDFSESEIELQHSMNCGLCSFDHAGIHVNLIDSPGYPDFYNRSIAALSAVETAAVVINAVTGVELVAQRVMDAAAKRDLCRLIIINKIDLEEAKLETVFNEIQLAFGKECLPLNLPADNGKKVVDCYFNPADETTDFSSVSEAHDAIIDQVVEVDEELMEIYLEQEESLSPEQLHDPFEKALREGHLIPVCFTSAETGAGMNQLLKIFEELMPNPFEGNPPKFLKGSDDKKVELSHEPDAHLLAHVFKVEINAFYGRLGIFRIHQGTMHKNTQFYIGDERKTYKLTQLLKLQGKQQSTIEQGVCGDICAVAKINEIEYDSVLHDHHDEDFYHLKQINFLPPMYGLSIKSKRQGDEQKVSEVLSKLEVEDPALLIEHRVNVGETILRGSSELHLRSVMEKMKKHYNLEVETNPPSIAYTETITKSADGHYRHKKQSGGAGQFGEVYLSVEPLQRGEGIEIVNKVKGGTIPSQFIPAVEKGVYQAIESGIYAGYPLQDIRIIILDGKHHSVDSKEIAFVFAGKNAFIDAVEKANPVVLEPIVDMAITIPAESTGSINADISTMRGMITNSTTGLNNHITVNCQVPISEIDGYQTRLNSETGGEGTYSIKFSCYQPAPAKIQKQLHQHFKDDSA